MIGHIKRIMKVKKEIETINAQNKKSIDETGRFFREIIESLTKEGESNGGKEGSNT